MLKKWIFQKKINFLSQNVVFWKKTCENFNISTNNIICVKAAKEQWWTALHFVKLQTIYLQGFVGWRWNKWKLVLKGKNIANSPRCLTTIFLTFSHRVHFPYEEMFRLAMSWNQTTNVKLI